MATIDIALRTVCFHRIFGEQQDVKSDGQTIRIERPVASKKTLALRINGYVMPDESYDIVKDELSVDDNGIKLVLREARKSWMDDIAEVDYNTSVSNCRICHGQNDLDDFRYSKLGGIVFLGDREKLRQDLDKFILTEIQSNIFHRWYGTSVPALIGSKIANFALLQRRLAVEIRDGIEKIIDLQRQQEEYQVLSDGEVALKFEDIGVDLDNFDTVRIDFSVLVRDLDSMAVSQVYQF